MRNKISTLLLVLILFYSSNYAGGFQINEHGARAMALGGAFTALAKDASAIYFNPAGITSLSGINVMLGTTLIAPSASFRGPSPSVTEATMNTQYFTPSHFYATYKADEQWSVGLGFNNPFGLGTKWDETWVGRFVSIEADLKTFSLNPVVAYKVLDNLSISGGFMYNFASVKLVRKIAFAPIFPGESKINLNGDAKSAFGFNAGVLYSPTDELSLGFSYRSKVKYEFKGDAKSEGQPPQLDSKVPSGNITAKFSAPAQWTAGIAYRVLPELMLSADYQSVMWSSYDSLKVEFENTAFEPLAAPREYQDSYTLRFGAEYSCGGALTLCGGFLYDKNPVPDERLDASLPDANRMGFSFGLGYKVTDKIAIDMSYLFLRFKERTVDNTKISNSGTDGFIPFNGTYNSSASLFSFSLLFNL